MVFFSDSILVGHSSNTKNTRNSVSIIIVDNYIIFIRIDLNKFWIKNSHFLILYSYLKLIQINAIDII